jgi:DNA-binding response OmpR family regulator
MTKAKILIVEDDPKVVVFIVDQLEYLGHQVAVARNGVEGLEKVKEERPDLIVLDVMMPEMDGYEVCHRLKSSPETENIPILMLTAKGQIQDKVKGFEIGADDYLPKPYDKAEFEARVRALLKRSASPPFVTTQSDCVLSLSCKPEHRINIRVSGTVAFNDTTKKALDIDPDAYARQADNAPCLDWRFNGKQWGKQLYRQVFVDHPEILGNYNQALGAVKDEEKLHLRFECARDFLRVPLEFLFEEVHAGADYLVLKHPLSRSLTGMHVKRMPLSPGFLNDLWAKGEQLRILLVASNTRPAIPGVDQEIEALDGSLKEMFEDRGISAQVKTIPTEQATYQTVRNELQKCRYHIVHYAGHGTYDRQSPEKGYLSFWEKPNRQGDVKRMPASELHILLRGADLRFVYLSCCLGTKTGEPAQLLDDDFLGIADGIVHAGVPAVLGFRWPVSDSGAKTLALAFYESLAKQGQIDTALLKARCEIAARDRDDITWLSPILIMQA